MASKSGQKFAVCSTVRHLTAIGLATGWTLHLWAKLAKLRRKDEKGEVESLEKYEKSHLDFLLTPKPNFCSSILTTWYNLPIFQDLTSKPDCIVFPSAHSAMGACILHAKHGAFDSMLLPWLDKSWNPSNDQNFLSFHILSILFSVFHRFRRFRPLSVYCPSSALTNSIFCRSQWRTCTLLRFDFQVNIFKSTPVNFLSFTST